MSISIYTQGGSSPMQAMWTELIAARDALAEQAEELHRLRKLLTKNGIDWSERRKEQQ